MWEITICMRMRGYSTWVMVIWICFTVLKKKLFSLTNNKKCCILVLLETGTELSLTKYQNFIQISDKLLPVVYTSFKTFAKSSHSSKVDRPSKTSIQWNRTNCPGTFAWIRRNWPVSYNWDREECKEEGWQVIRSEWWGYYSCEN